VIPLLINKDPPGGDFNLEIDQPELQKINTSLRSVQAARRNKRPIREPVPAQ